VVDPEDGILREYRPRRAIEPTGGSEVAAPPCAIMEEGDDAEAIEASLLENLARRDPDPMREYETFVRLIKEGRTVDGIAATFGMTTTQVKQRLALGNLLPKIRDAYRVEEIDDETVRHLTLASVAQQRKWLRLFHDPHQSCPRGYQLKQWLLGGQQIATSHALFKLADYTGQTIEDLFGEDSYFADADLFWALQNRAIAAKRDALLKAGWVDVEVMEIGQRFAQYEHIKTPKKKGGKVFVAVSHDGAVEIFDGWLTQKEAKRLAKQEEREAKGAAKESGSAAKPTITQALANYVDLHRHAVVRLALLANPSAAFRLIVAHMIAPSGNWSVKPDPQTTRNPAIRESIAASTAQKAFDAEEQAPHCWPGWSKDADELSHGPDTAEVFAALLAKPDAEVLRIAAFHMARSLEAGSDVVDVIGAHLAVDARVHWHPDVAFFDLIRDRATLNAILAEVGGETVARANVTEKAKTQKQIVRDCLAGAKGRTKVEGWLPGWLEFPFRGYDDRPAAPGTGTVEPEHDRAAA
jgi:ParB family transcriptional regulator, chromosome partitioning protein